VNHDPEVRSSTSCTLLPDLTSGSGFSGGGVDNDNDNDDGDNNNNDDNDGKTYRSWSLLMLKSKPSTHLE
jgi:hypothetical protein